jgi:excinuclease ABC subunit B
MFAGDVSRKSTLVSHGFRLPSALDNRPLYFEEFESLIKETIYVSATPADYEMAVTETKPVEQIARPTGLVDPAIEVRSAVNQVDDLLEEIRLRQQRQERVLVTTLTKRMAEDLTEYYADLGIQVRYLHSDIGTLERMDIIRDLRSGVFDVLVGINLLREGLDLPEVSLVAILDADKEGFLRSTRSLIQTFGRAARNVNGTVVMYADGLTNSMKAAIDETDRRRSIQNDYNHRHDITPETIRKAIEPAFVEDSSSERLDGKVDGLIAEKQETYQSLEEVDRRVHTLEKEMQAAAKDLDFERAAQLRDKIKSLKELVVF